MFVDLNSEQPWGRRCASDVIHTWSRHKLGLSTSCAPAAVLHLEDTVMHFDYRNVFVSVVRTLFQTQGSSQVHLGVASCCDLGVKGSLGSLAEVLRQGR